MAWGPQLVVVIHIVVVEPGVVVYKVLLFMRAHHRALECGRGAEVVGAQTVGDLRNRLDGAHHMRTHLAVVEWAHLSVV